MMNKLLSFDLLSMWACKIIVIAANYQFVRNARFFLGKKMRSLSERICAFNVGFEWQV